MIGGQDVVIETTRTGFAIPPLLDAVLGVWPDALFQDAEQQGSRSLIEALADPATEASREFFVYRDRASADSWAREGWTEEHSNDMAHFLVVEDATRPGSLQLTVVLGSVGESFQFLGAVYDALGRMKAGEESPKEHSGRVDWDAELRAVGYTQGRDRFYEEVEAVHKRLHADWTADELACHPREALRFCEAVRQEVAPVPDHLVMKALMNRRRQGREQQSGPR